MTALVLSGGGARGAYAAGVVAGLAEVLADRGIDRPPIDVFSGTSVGAVNAAWCAAHADEPGWQLPRLLDMWRSLRVERYLDLNLTSLIRLIRGVSHDERGLGWSLLKSDALQTIVEDLIPWSRLHENIQQGQAKALIVPALRVADGRTHIFVEKARNVEFHPSRDPGRQPRFGPISSDHVLASAAFPFLFPARRIGEDFFADGGLRFNTPIAPAIRCGCDRLIVVSLLSNPPTRELATDVEKDYPRPSFLAGKLLNALLLDPVEYDLEVLAHTNEMIQVMEEHADGATLGRIREVHQRTRGLPYRRLKTLVFAPSRNVAQMAGEHAATLRGRGAPSWFLERATRISHSWEADFLSFVLFDGEFASELLALGRADVLAKRRDTLDFFGL